MNFGSARRSQVGLLLVLLGGLTLWPLAYGLLFSEYGFLEVYDPEARSRRGSGENPYTDFQPLRPVLVGLWFRAYTLSFAVLATVVAFAAVKNVRARRLSRLSELSNNCWALPVYAWALQTALYMAKFWTHKGWVHHPLFSRPGTILLPIFGMLAVLLTFQAVAVLVLDREVLPDGLGGKVGFGAKIALLTIVLDLFFYFFLIRPPSFWAAR